MRLTAVRFRACTGFVTSAPRSSLTALQNTREPSAETAFRALATRRDRSPPAAVRVQTAPPSCSPAARSQAEAPRRRACPRSTHKDPAQTAPRELSATFELNTTCCRSGLAPANSSSPPNCAPVVSSAGVTSGSKQPLGAVWQLASWRTYRPRSSLCTTSHERRFLHVVADQPVRAERLRQTERQIAARRRGTPAPPPAEDPSSVVRCGVAMSCVDQPAAPRARDQLRRFKRPVPGARLHRTARSPHR